MGGADSRTVVGRAVCGGALPRIPVGPLAVHFCARWAGVSLRTYTLDARVLADCVIQYYEAFRPDAVWLSADTWVTAEAMGAAVAFPGDEVPLGGTGEPRVRTAADLDRIPPPDPYSQGRWPLMLEALPRIRQGVGPDVWIVACFDQYPFSLACALLGIQRAMMLLMEDRPLVEALMERCLEYTVAYAAALAQGGADLLSGGDSPAGLIHPTLYREVALPFEARVIQQLHEQTTLPVSLHICGDTRHRLIDMVRSGADVLELDEQVDWQTVLTLRDRQFRPDAGDDLVDRHSESSPVDARVRWPCIWGNLSTQRLAAGTPDQVRCATRDLIRFLQRHHLPGWVVSSGCTLAPDTPPENLRAMIQTVREEGVRPRDDGSLRRQNRHSDTA